MTSFYIIHALDLILSRDGERAGREGGTAHEHIAPESTGDIREFSGVNRTSDTSILMERTLCVCDAPTKSLKESVSGSRKQQHGRILHASPWTVLTGATMDCQYVHETNNCVV